MKGLFALLALVALSAAAHEGKDHPASAKSGPVETAFGRTGDARKVTRTIEVGMYDTMRYAPDAIEVKRGETVRFVLQNHGKVMHEMVIGTTRELDAHAKMMREHPGMEHHEPFMAHVSPDGKGEIVWQFTMAGEFRYACLIPGHFEAGMVGRITVK
jgi:uncharacterized cupredoxin-like copper-binding protein